MFAVTQNEGMFGGVNKKRKMMFDDTMNFNDLSGNGKDMGYDNNANFHSSGNLGEFNEK